MDLSADSLTHSRGATGSQRNVCSDKKKRLIMRHGFYLSDAFEANLTSAKLFS